MRHFEIPNGNVVAPVNSDKIFNFVSPYGEGMDGFDFSARMHRYRPTQNTESISLL